MLKFEKKLPAFDTFAQLLGYTPETSLFLDIETTGLSPAATTLYLIGVIAPEDGGRTWRLTQWLAENKQEEPLLLLEFTRFLDTCDTLIHFNGSNFDLPYLEEKLRQSKLPNTLPEKKSLDLYRTFRPLKPFLGLAHMNQRTLQTFLGQKRSDPLGGKALIPFWHRYADAPDPALADMLLGHNQEDLCGMLSLLCLSSYLALFGGNISSKSCKLQDNSAVITLHLEYPLPQNIQAVHPAVQAAQDDHPAQYLLTTDFTNAILEVPAFRGELLYFFSNYRDYYYLPLENQAIHRSVASFVDRSHRVPAKPSNCFTRKNGTFLLQPSELITPLFVPYYRSRDLYFEYTENYELHPELLSDYVKTVLKLFL